MQDYGPPIADDSSRLLVGSRLRKEPLQFCSRGPSAGGIMAEKAYHFSQNATGSFGGAFGGLRHLLGGEFGVLNDSADKAGLWCFLGLL